MTQFAHAWCRKSTGSRREAGEADDRGVNFVTSGVEESSRIMQDSSVRILILGGTWFVGRVLAEDAVRRGWDVTVFHRGLSGSSPQGARVVLGNREDKSDLRRLAAEGPWDVAVDVSGSIPAVVGLSSRVLSHVIDRLVFVSTISVYKDWPHKPVDESSSLWSGDPDFDPGTRSWDPDAYGPLKVGCELACRRVFADDQLLILRPHVILGRYEYVGRLPWWLNRVRMGGRTLLPAPDRRIQPIDVRDLTNFLLDLVRIHQSDVLNVASTSYEETFGDLVRACELALGNDLALPLEPIWVDEDWLVSQGVTQWTELPLWRNAAAPWSMSLDRAAARGLSTRSIYDTAADPWAWLRTGNNPIPHERFTQHGIEPGRETQIIDRWTRRRQKG
jgi:2'-hydroxyisoflavone reductase